MTETAAEQTRRQIAEGLRAHELAEIALRQRYDQLSQIPGPDAYDEAQKYWKAMCLIQNFRRDVLTPLLEWARR